MFEPRSALLSYFFAAHIHHTALIYILHPNETAKKIPAGFEPAPSSLEHRGPNHYANETRQLIFMTACYDYLRVRINLV